MPEESLTSTDWSARVEQSFHQTLSQLIERAPQILGAVLLFVVGWLVALLLRFIAKKLILGANALLARLPRSKNLDRFRIGPAHTRIVGAIVFWATVFIFLAASANVLGWSLVTEWLDRVVGFLPNLVSGLLIVFVGIVLGNLARSAVTSAVARTSVSRSEWLGRIAQAIVIFGFAVVGIEQIGLDLHFLTEVFVVVLGVLIAGAALAFGLGAKTFVANIIGAQRFRRHCNIGEKISIGDLEGEVVELTQTTIVLDSKEGRTLVPAKFFQEQASRIRAGDEGDEVAKKEGAESK